MSSPTGGASTGVVLGGSASGAKEVLQSVKEYYGQVLHTQQDLRTPACCAAEPPPPGVWQLLAKVPDEIMLKFYGCGSPTPEGIEGLRVLDLGCGSGRDCYVSAGLVGEQGSVVGVDMTESQLDVARRHAHEFCTKTLGYARPNMRFLQGEIERLGEAGIAEGSVDIIISNCVVNLSPDKPAVLREAFRALAPGGEVYFSDVYCDRRLPEEIRTHPVLLGECLGGAMYERDFRSICREAGFIAPLSMMERPFEVTDPELRALLGGARFKSVTYRLFKLEPGMLEGSSEDYGQAATYLGTVQGHPHAYAADSQLVLQAGKWYPVSGDLAAILQHSWLAKHFKVIGDRSRHFGPFMLAQPAASNSADESRSHLKSACSAGARTQTCAGTQPMMSTAGADPSAEKSCCGGLHGAGASKPPCCGGAGASEPAAG